MQVKKLSRRQAIAATAAVGLVGAPFVRSANAAGTLTIGMWDHWVPGANEGARGNGAPPRTKVGPVSSFLKGSEHYYRAVWKHVKGCARCDPAEILRGFLANRDARQHGQTSAMLIEMAEKYKRHFKDRIPDELVREFVVRGASAWEAYEERIGRLSPEEIVRSHDLYMAAWKADVLECARRRKRARTGWPFERGQASIGWLNEGERSRLGRKIPYEVLMASYMTREDAMGTGGWDLMVWLITRHDRYSALGDPDVRHIVALDIAEDVMGG